MFDTMIPLSKSLYSSTTVLKAAYSFLDRAYFHVGDNGSSWEVWIKSKSGNDTQQIVSDYENEIISQAVRERVFNQTKSIREMLIARAITSTMIDTEDTIQRIQVENDGVSDEELETILKSWFDQYEVD